MTRSFLTALVAVLAFFAPINVMAADFNVENMTTEQQEDLAAAVGLAIGKSFAPLDTSASIADSSTMTPAEMGNLLSAMAAFGRNLALVGNPRAEFFKALPAFLMEVHTIVLIDGRVTQYPLDASETSLVMVIGNEIHDPTNWFAPFPTSPYTLPAVNGFAPLTIELPDEAAILIRVAPADGMDCLQQVFKRFDFPRTDGSGMDTVSVQKCI